MAKVRLQIAKDDIGTYFEDLNQPILKRSDIDNALSEQRDFWRLAQSTTAREFIEFLKISLGLKEYVFDFPHRKETRYAWPKASDYEIILSIKPDSYFTHFTAMFFNGLTQQVPKTIYLNFEQPRRSSPGNGLAQERIDYAFKRPCRVSKNITVFRERRICLLNGMHTGQRGVIDSKDSAGNPIRVTNLERTLLDVTVRPIYSGGVHSVLEAYRRAHENVSINKLAAVLKSMEYTYPYHQAVGFYLERTLLYTDRQLELIHRLEQQYDFYLTHQMKEMEYSKKWRLYYPKGL